MKKYWIKDLTEKQVIHAPTADIAKKLCDKFHELGFKWINGYNYINVTNWRRYGDETCYSPSTGEFCSLRYYAQEACEILTIDQLMDFQENEYPKVMEVTNGGDVWHKRVVFMEKNGEFLAWAGAETIKEAESINDVSAWSYAREIQLLPTIELTIDEIAVKLTIKNRQKVLKTLRDAEQEYRATYRWSVLKNNKLEYKVLYLYYSADSKLWITSLDKPKDKTLIKPKQLKELLESEALIKYWENPFWQGNPLWEVIKDDIGNKDEKHNPENKTPIQGTWTITGSVQNSELIGVKGGIGDKGIEYNPKTLEAGKWYKYQGFGLNGNVWQIIFLFNGTKSNGRKTIGFDINGKYCDNMNIYYSSAEIVQEISHQEVIEAFIYHMKNFAK